MRTVLLRVVLLAGAAAVAAAADPTPLPVTLLLALVVAALAMTAVTRREALVSALASATSSVIVAFTRVVVPAPAPWVPSSSTRRGLVDVTGRGAFRRLQRPDVAGKPRARAPGRA